jgi:hypothetical protein
VTDELLFRFLFLEFPLRLDNQAIARDCDLEVFFLDTGDVGAYDELSVLEKLLHAVGERSHCPACLVFFLRQNVTDLGHTLTSFNSRTGNGFRRSLYKPLLH